MVGNVELVADSNSKWAVQNANIVAKVSDVGISKELSVSSVAIGTEYTNTITATVPKYPTNARNTTYVIEEVFADGITLPDIASIIIKDGTTTLTNTNGAFKNASGNTVAVISVSGQKMTITFTATDVSANVVTITYNTALNDSATLGNSNPNSSTTTLTYSDSPYTPLGTNTIEVNNDVYTYAISISARYEANTSGAGISGVVFDIYSDSSLTTKVGSVTTDSNGNVIFKGVSAGTYYLKNTKASPGYNLANLFSLEVGGITILTDGYYLAEIMLQSSPDLPFTGGIGTIIYTAIGLIVIVSSVALFYVYRKKK